MKYVCTIFLFALAFNLKSQVTQDQFQRMMAGNNAVVTTYAKYVGGEGAMTAFIRKNIKNTLGLPIEDVTVICKAKIDSTGEVLDVVLTGFKGKTVNKSFYTGEAVRVIKLMPPWTPATKADKPIIMDVVISIPFKEYFK